jgi:hypothetical protein
VFGRSYKATKTKILFNPVKVKRRSIRDAGAKNMIYVLEQKMGKEKSFF